MASSLLDYNFITAHCGPVSRKFARDCWGSWGEQTHFHTVGENPIATQSWSILRAAIKIHMRFLVFKRVKDGNTFDYSYQ